MVSIEVSSNGDEAAIRVSSLVVGLPAADIFLVRILPESLSSIQRGENAGKTIRYVNIVEEMTLITRWNGQTEITASVSLKSDAKYVLLVQAKDFGPILGAAYLR